MTDTTEVPKDILDDIQGGLSCWQTFRFFLKYSI